MLPINQDKVYSPLIVPERIQHAANIHTYCITVYFFLLLQREYIMLQTFILTVSN